MTISDSFAPLTGFLGGALIGLAAVVLLLLNGRIAGISGIVGGILRPAPGEVGWRLAFVFGLIAGPVLAKALHIAPFDVPILVDSAVLVVGGLLVGFGTRLGNGCTSGHGVCGLARGSRRSLSATITFIFTAMVTVAIVRHVL